MTAIKDYFLQISDPKPVDIPEWQVTIFVGPMTIGQWQPIEAAMKISDSERNLKLIEMCAKNESGAPAFSAEQLRDMRAFGTIPVIKRVVNDMLAAMPGDTFAADLEGAQEKKH